jgi:hypothetical protein
VAFWKDAYLELRITLCQVCADDVIEGLKGETK